MSLLVIDPGLSTTVQDGGRPGYQAFGVPPAGAFDRLSADLANALVGNVPDAAVLETTLIGGAYEARSPLVLALAGAPMDARIERVDGTVVRLSIPMSFPVECGERLVLGATPRGARTYLAVRGGWLTPVVLGSRSSETRVKAGEVLPCAPGASPFRRLRPNDATMPAVGLIRVVAGPDYAQFSVNLSMHDTSYRVLPQSDRVGLRLDGAPWMMADDPNRVSTPVAPGAVQAAGGRPLILGIACGTMGGYPHVFHVISADLPRLAQARPGDRLRLELVGLDEARRLGREARAAHRQTCLRVATAVRGGSS
jgi:biotin-dependent carboxylase-like uncharacterized protein